MVRKKCTKNLLEELLLKIVVVSFSFLQQAWVAKNDIVRT